MVQKLATVQEDMRSQYHCCMLLGVFDLIAAKESCCRSIFVVELPSGEGVLKRSLNGGEFTHESFLSHAFNLTDSLHKHMVVRSPVA